MNATLSGLPEALYLHIPFCRARCSYCDFESSALCEAGVSPRRYADALVELLQALRDRGFLGACRTAYLGGGTPTILGDALPRVIAEVRKATPCLEEVTFEANPESATRELLDKARAAGADRVSIGVQSLDDSILSRIGRIHTADEARRAIAQAADLGFRVSADLMAGLPGEGVEDLSRDALEVASLGTTHVSLYPLEVHPSTPLGARVKAKAQRLPDEDEVAESLEIAQTSLSKVGFARYEVASFARAGEESHHNLRYWDGSAYLALGPSGASMLPKGAYDALREVIPALPEAPRHLQRLRLTCISSAERMVADPTLASLDFRVEGMGEGAAIAEDLMLAARCTRGIPADLDVRAKRMLGKRYEDSCARLVERGLLCEGEDEAFPLRPTQAAWLLSNEIFGEFWALTPDEPVMLA